MRIALAQVNPVVGDLEGNRALVAEFAGKAAARGADLVVFPELVLTGYPPMDLLERTDFVERQLSALDALGPASREVAIVLGVTLPSEREGMQRLSNAAVVLSGGERIGSQAKTLLPNYDVFDETRYFRPATSRRLVTLPGGARIGLTVCEDAWCERIPYAIHPVQEFVEQGAEVVLNLAASPWHQDKPALRRAMFAELARRYRIPMVFVNQVGGNDELVFDGGSFGVDSAGRIAAAAPLFESHIALFETAEGPVGTVDPTEDEPRGPAQLEAALVLGIRDYFHKLGLPLRAVIGLSGGIDSAVTAHLATLALGADAISGVLMPGPFSSDHSVADALALARNLGIPSRTVDIRKPYEEFQSIFRDLFGDRQDYGLAGQNIQARLRGAVLMAIANAEGRLVLATGNKSELSVGYCTLYGDMVGGLAVLGDVYKGDVYALARYANRQGERIPASSIEKPPSAELAPDQRDEDDLPPYPVLDAVLRQLIEGGCNPRDLTAPAGASPDAVGQIAARLAMNEYKRRQGPLVLRTSTKAFGSGRRLPIVQRDRGA